MATKKKAKITPKREVKFSKKEAQFAQLITDNIINALSKRTVSDAGQESNFSYEFDLQGCKVTNFVVGHFISSNPAPSGKFYTPIYDPSTPPEIHVAVIAVQNLPGCSGTLTLKYMSKDVFATPKQIVFSGGMGSINEIVKLPI